MKLNQLEALLWVSRLRSFRGAAAHLNTTQPGISLRIKALERDLGVRLIDRVRGRITPTAEGKDCIAVAEQIFLLTSQLSTRRRGQGNLAGRVNLGVSDLVAQTWLPKLITLITNRYPEVRVDVTVDVTPPLVRGLETGDFDVVLVGSHRLATTFPTLELGSETYAWVEKANSKSSVQPVRPRDLQARRIITTSRGAAIYQSIEKWFIEGGVYPSHRITCNTTAAMTDLVAAGVGVALLPIALIERQLKAKTLAIIPSEPEFEPVRYRAIYVPAPGSLGEVVANAAVEVSTFQKAHKRSKVSRRR